MRNGVAVLKRVGVTLYLLVLHIALVYFIGERLIDRLVAFAPVPAASVEIALKRPDSPTPVTGLPTPVMDEFPTPSPTIEGGMVGLIVPVAGVRPDQLTDTFTQSRGPGRTHDAIDIMASEGTPVVAAADGEIIKFFDSVPGGITIYQLSKDRRYVYYYAHLQRRADDLKVGEFVSQGRTIAYVGNTGNAGPGNYHLHFSIMQVADPKRYWEGTYIDPYPYLRAGTSPGGP